MPYKVKIRPLAVIEILEAYDWYELQREGLGMEFLDELESFYNALLKKLSKFSFTDFIQAQSCHSYR